MARIPITLDADGTISAVIEHDAGSGAPYYTHGNDAPDGVSSDYIQNDNSETTGTAWFSLGNLSNFSSINLIDIEADVQAVGFSDDTCTLTARIYDADNDTTNALSDESGNLGTDADSTRTQRSVSLTTPAGSAAQWTAAHVRLTWTYAKSTGPDNANLRLFGINVYVNYEVTTPTAVNQIGSQGIFANAEEGAEAIASRGIVQMFDAAAGPGGGRVMSSLAANGGLAGMGGIAGQGGGLAG